MIRIITFLIYCLIIQINVYSQVLIKQKCYKSYNGECIPELQIYKNDDGTYLIKKYNANGTYKLIANNSNSNQYKLDGYIKFFSDNGVIESEGTYKMNHICCEWKVYNDKGELEKEISYNFEKIKTDTLTIFKENKNIDSTFEQMPMFNNGGIEAFREYVSRHVFYPPLSEVIGIQGKIYVQFSIDKYGNVVDAKVIRGINKDLDYESLRVIKNSPKWMPAYKNGVPTSFQFVIPIIFTIKKI